MKNKILSIILFLLLMINMSLYAKDDSTCYSVQLLSSYNFIDDTYHFPDGSTRMHIGKVYTVRNGCFDNIKEVKQNFKKLSKKFPKAVIVSTYRFRFKNKIKSKKNKNNLFTHCRFGKCKKINTLYPWQSASLENAKRLVHINENMILPVVNTVEVRHEVLNKDQNTTEQEITQDLYRFYINPFVSIYEGQTPIGASKLYSRTAKINLGLQYWHFYNKNWHFFTDIRLIPYHVEKNSFSKNGLKFDIKELYWMSNGTFDNQMNFLIGRKILKDKRSWYYNTSLDTVGIFNKHDLLSYSIYAGTRLNSNIIIDGTSSNKHDLKNIKFLIAHASYEYYINNTIEAFGVYEDTATIEDRKLAWLGLRAEGNVPMSSPAFHYWVDIAQVNGTSKQNFKQVSVKGLGLDVGAEYNFNNLQDKFTISYAYGSGGENNCYTQPYITNNRSNYLSKHLYFRYYGSFLDPELSNIKISSLYYSHEFNTKKATTAVVALHNYKQVVASNTQYAATSYTVMPNGLNSDLGNELDLIVGQYFQEQYDWRFVIAYFLGGTAFNGVASDKDGIYGQFNFRYYW